MVRTDAIHPAIIKRSGVIATSFLIATLAMVIINASSASALLGVELPLGKNVAPLTDRVNGLLNKGLGLPVTIDSTDKVKVNLGKVADINVTVPVVPALVDGITEPVDGVVGGVSNTLRPVTDNTLPSVRGALSRLGNSNTPTSPQATTPPSAISPDSDIAGVATTAPNAQSKSDTESSLSQQPTFFGGVTSFFASTMPGALRDIARTITGKEVGLIPAIISIIVFLMTLGAIGSIVYASNHGGVMSFGRHKFTLFKNGSDRTEMATFTVVAICFGFVAMFLALTSL